MHSCSLGRERMHRFPTQVDHVVNVADTHLSETSGHVTFKQNFFEKIRQVDESISIL